MNSRRNFLNSSLMLSTLSTLPSIALCASTRFKMQGLEKQIIKRVQEITGAKSITLKVLYPKGSFANIKPVIEAFESKTSIKFSYQEVDVDSINTEILLNHALGEFNYDIALPATFGISDLVEAGALENLDKYARKYEPIAYQKESLYTLGDYYKNSLYGYQTDGDTYLMFYNKNFLDNADKQKQFFDQHGYALTIPKTWQELDTQIEFFHRPDSKQYGGSLYRTPNYTIWEWWMRFHAKGALPVNDAFEPQINNIAGVQALEELISVSKYLHPDSGVNGLFDNWKAYAEGNTYCNIGWGGTQKYLNSSKSKVRGNLLYAPMPGEYINGQLLKAGYFNWGWNYVVSNLSQQKELSYLFTLFACSPRISTIAVREPEGYFDPFRELHYEDPKINEIYSKEFLNAHKESMKNSIPDFYVQNQEIYINKLKENIYLAVKGELSPQKALDLTVKEWNILTTEIGRGKQIKQWKFLKSSYPNAFLSLI